MRQGPLGSSKTSLRGGRDDGRLRNHEEADKNHRRYRASAYLKIHAYNLAQRNVENLFGIRGL